MTILGMSPQATPVFISLVAHGTSNWPIASVHCKVSPQCVIVSEVFLTEKTLVMSNFTMVACSYVPLQMAHAGVDFATQAAKIPPNFFPVHHFYISTTVAPINMPPGVAHPPKKGEALYALESAAETTLLHTHISLSNLNYISKILSSNRPIQIYIIKGHWKGLRLRLGFG